MSDDELVRFLAETRDVVLGTINRDGTPALNPVWYLYRDGRFLLSMNRRFYYARNLLRDPRVTLCVHQERRPVQAVTVRGRAETAPDTEFGVTREIALRYMGTEEGTREADRAWREERDDLLVATVVPERVVSWDFARGA